MIILHHLRIGRSVFTAWLIEELGLEYEAKIYVRNEMGRAPPELKGAHPLGKSPVIEHDGMTLAESGAIATYLIDLFDAENTLAPPRSDVKARAVWNQWLAYSEASAFAPFLFKLLLSREQQPHPPVISAFASGEVALQLGYIRDQLGDRPFILGDRFQAPDVGLTYILSMARRLNELDGHPTLGAYLDRNLARPAFQRAFARTGG
ncbi:glutathione S-transferase family protein [bacterium]|nr:glutathione S-transferase family protein [bacterium]